MNIKLKKRIIQKIIIFITIVMAIFYLINNVKYATDNSEIVSKEVVNNKENTQNEESKENKEEEQEIIVEQRGFDLSIRMFASNINERELKNQEDKYSREPNIHLKSLNAGEVTTAEYKGQKAPVRVAEGDIVIYTIRIYNEGGISGYASSITDYLPPQLEFVINDEENFNAQYGWRIDPTLRKATTNILDMPSIDPEDTLIKAFDGETLDYKEVKIKCKVICKNYIEKLITNIVEITDFKDEEGEEIADRDSHKENVIQQNDITDEILPDYKGNKSNKSVLIDTNYFYKGIEDDDDFEKLILEEFDLSLKQFITKVNDTPITEREPVFKETYIYEQNKTPVEVGEGDIVEYTVRVYNEGDIAGYAKEIKNDIPEGLEFLPENLINQIYSWTMLDENGNETKDLSNAVEVKTNYLSKEQEIRAERNNLIKNYTEKEKLPDYREIKILYKVTNKSGIITNTSQISESTDENGRPVEDRDSIANKWNEEEDDQDTEQIQKKIFDLGIIKMLNQAAEQETNTEQILEQESNTEQIETEQEVETQQSNNENVAEIQQKQQNELEAQQRQENEEIIKKFLLSMGALPII